MAKRILIVDDSSFMRKMIKKILTENEYEVVGEAKNGLEAVTMYRQLKPDLVTMDITMPDMNGIKSLKAIRLIDPHARVIMLSAMGQKNFLIEAIELGAVGFVTKPFTKDQILQAVQRAFFKIYFPKYSPQ